MLLCCAMLCYAMLLGTAPTSRCTACRPAASQYTRGAAISGRLEASRNLHRVRRRAERICAADTRTLQRLSACPIWQVRRAQHGVLRVGRDVTVIRSYPQHGAGMSLQYEACVRYAGRKAAALEAAAQIGAFFTEQAPPPPSSLLRPILSRRSARVSRRRWCRQDASRGECRYRCSARRR